MLRRVLALFGLALKSDLDQALELALISTHYAMALAEQVLTPTTTDNTPRQ